MLSRAPVVALLAVAASIPVGAQHTLRGVVRDPVVRGGPLAGAEVVVLNTSLHAVTDDSGRYAIANVPRGRHVIVVSHPVLDTLGLAELEHEVEMSGARTLDFSTPTLAEYQAERCGRALAVHEAMVTGFVSNADGEMPAGAAVHAAWVERRMRAGGSEQLAREARATAGEDGAFVLCGVPREPALSRDSAGVVIVRSTATLSASAPSGEATGELVMLAVHPAVVRHDVVLGMPSPVAAVTGRVVAEDGRVLAGARITRSGADSTAAVADAAGRFTMHGVPRRSEQVVVRAVGHQPVSVEFVPDDERLDVGDVPLAAFVFSLGTVEVRADRATREKAEFEERRLQGLGTFLDDEEIKRLPKLTPQIVAARVQRADPIRNPDGSTVFAFKRVTLTETRCVPPTWVDGVKMDSLLAREQEEILRTAVRVEVYTAQFAPARFTDFKGCGALVVWTR